MAQTDMEIRDADPAKLAPQALVGEIERTRTNLAATIDEIVDRVMPANLAKRATDRAKERAGEIDPLVGGAVALAAVSVTCYLIWRKVKKSR